MILWTLVIGVLILLWLLKLNKDYHVMSLFTKRFKTIDGTPLEEVVSMVKGDTIFGNSFDLIGLDNIRIFELNRKYANELQKSYIQYVFGQPVYNIITAEDAELVLNDQNLITKGFVYSFLHPFLNTGLLTSTGRKWHSRRKMLTPAFHFNILAQYEEIFKEESEKFVRNIKSLNSDVISVSELIPKFTLNSVCESALGVELDDCSQGDDYRASFKMIEECFVKRFQNPLFFNDTIYNLYYGKTDRKHLEVVHKFSSEIIEKRRKLFREEQEKIVDDKQSEEDSFINKKKRYAMLDTLLLAEKDGLIDHYGICEEVDTFMFEGFDTTSMGLIFGLMNLSLYPDIQERCHQEIIENIDDDLNQLNVAQLGQLKYLECFIKETLRLYPSVPSIARLSTSETKLGNNLIVPSGTSIVIQIFDIHRNPKYFPNPEVFDPERFTPENSKGRPPFAFVPFSAGQRNCIGQKFAMAEMKTLLVYILKNFKVLPVLDIKEFNFEAGIIIRTKNNIKVKLVKRE